MPSTIDPVTRRLKIYREADFVDVVQWLHDGTPVNLSGYTIEGVIKQAYADASPAATFAVTVLNAAQGLFEISLTEVQTAALAFDAGVFDVRATLGAITQQLMRGTVRVYPSAT